MFRKAFFKGIFGILLKTYCPVNDYVAKGRKAFTLSKNLVEVKTLRTGTVARASNHRHMLNSTNMIIGRRPSERGTAVINAAAYMESFITILSIL